MEGEARRRDKLLQFFSSLEADEADVGQAARSADFLQRPAARNDERNLRQQAAGGKDAVDAFFL